MAFLVGDVGGIDGKLWVCYVIPRCSVSFLIRDGVMVDAEFIEGMHLILGNG